VSVRTTIPDAGLLDSRAALSVDRKVLVCNPTGLLNVLTIPEIKRLVPEMLVHILHHALMDLEGPNGSRFILPGFQKKQDYDYFKHNSVSGLTCMRVPLPYPQ
jgi:hypothetical protein